MKTNRVLLSLSLIFSLATVSAPIHAAAISGQGTWETTLQPRYLGNSSTIDAYYDTSLNITWLANANAVVGSTTPGIGLMTWDSANTWATFLNINGVTGWSLPTMTDPNATCINVNPYPGTNCGYNSDPASSELSHMFYTSLGNKSYYNTSGQPQSGYGLTNSGPFSNLQSDYYWSATGYSANISYAWSFVFNIGYQQNNTIKGGSGFAWAVHAGDVGTASPVPVPAAAWLLGSGLLGLIGVARRKAV